MTQVPAWAYAEQAAGDQQQQILVMGQHAADISAGRASLIRDLAQARAEYAHDVMKDAADADQKAGELTAQLAAASRRTEEAVLAAPIAGTVQDLATHTIGGVVTPAQALLTMVSDGAFCPDSDATVLEGGFTNASGTIVGSGETDKLTKADGRLTGVGNEPHHCRFCRIGYRLCAIGTSISWNRQKILRQAATVGTAILIDMVLLVTSVNASSLLDAVRMLVLQTDLTNALAVGHLLNVSFGPAQPIVIAYRNGVPLTEVIRSPLFSSEKVFGGLTYKVPPYQSSTALAGHEFIEAELTIGSPIPIANCVSTHQIKNLFGEPSAESHIGVDAPRGTEPNGVDWEIKHSHTLVVRLTTMAEGDDSACITALIVRQVSYSGK